MKLCCERKTSSPPLSSEVMGFTEADMSPIRLTYPPPANEQDFEELCLQLPTTADQCWSSLGAVERASPGLTSSIKAASAPWLLLSASCVAPPGVFGRLSSVKTLQEREPSHRRSISTSS